MTRASESDIDLGEPIRQGCFPIVQRRDATFEQAHFLMEADPNGNERSQFQWFRLPNGDLILGFFPQEEAYMEITDSIDI